MRAVSQAAGYGDVQQISMRTVTFLGITDNMDAQF
jgi:hypothetical protein